MPLKAGSKAPTFNLRDHNGEKAALKDFLGKWVVLYFYPKDNTSGCTLEANDFTKNKNDFVGLGAEIIGISPDSVESHRKFIEKQKLNITLLSDQDKKALEKYGVWQLKKMYGREYHGVVRSTFLIDPKGRIARIWEKVKVKGHVNDVINELKERKSG